MANPQQSYTEENDPVLYARHIALDVENVLGPGKRSVLWVSGCRGTCRGCMSQELKIRRPGDRIPVSLVAKILSENTRVTISGGEPFLQAKALKALLIKLREQEIRDTLIYTGFCFEDVLNKSDSAADAADILQMAAVIVDGPFIASLNDDKPLRGSSNQKVVVLTQDENLRKDYRSFMTGTRRNEVRLTDDGNILLIGMLKKQMEV